MRSPSILPLCTALGLAVAWPAASVHAWDDCGHKIVATIAWDQLTPKARTNIAALFEKDPRHRHFVDAAVWPDDIKTFERNDPPKAPVNKPWHYVNIPYDGTAQEIDAAIEKPGVIPDPKHMNSANVVTGIRYYTAVLKSGKGTPIQIADALSFLIHYVGDVHQPLHALIVRHPLPNYTPPLDGHGKPDDGGGNGFTLNGTPAKLHAWWDDLFDLGQPAGSNSDAHARTIATALEAKIHPGPYGMGKTDPRSWAMESYATRKFVYSPPIAASRNAGSHIQHHEITADYAKKARPIAEKQIVYAGYRLGKLLNGIYGQP